MPRLQQDGFCVPASALTPSTLTHFTILPAGTGASSVSQCGNTVYYLDSSGAAAGAAVRCGSAVLSMLSPLRLPLLKLHA